MLSIFLQHHISKASILFLSDFFKVHPSTPYWNTAYTIDFMTLTFVAVFIFRSFQILASTTAFCLANAMRQRNTAPLLPTSLLSQLHLLLVNKRINFKIATYAYQSLAFGQPTYLSSVHLISLSCPSAQLTTICYLCRVATAAMDKEASPNVPLKSGTT